MTDNNHSFSLDRPTPGVSTPAPAHPPAAKFQPLPAPTGKPPYRLDILTVLPKIGKSRMVFHTVGDTGGIKNAVPQHIVSLKMEEQVRAGGPDAPSFFYHLGDVLYYYGEMSAANDQFYEPYMHYPAPIFAIPGNHDGDINPDAPAYDSLGAFKSIFCTKNPVLLPQAGESNRTTMTQPHVYWTLETSVANIIGMYTNVPSNGKIDAAQKKWLVDELINADNERKKNNKAVLLALHHPPYSYDQQHGSSETMQKLFDEIFAGGITPDLILTAHVHNYQRFTRKFGKTDVPYLVAGAGGYFHLHYVDSVAKPLQVPLKNAFPGVTLESFCDNRHGFLRITIDTAKRKLKGEYFVVPRPQESWRCPAQLWDKFELNLATRKLKNYSVKTPVFK
jgi:hypothetical protein